MIYGYLYETIIGTIALAQKDNAIIELTFGSGFLHLDTIHEETKLLRKAREELEEYLEGKRKVFDLPLAPQEGPLKPPSAFRCAVWDALQKIPYGETRTYGQIAVLTGNPKGSRAVGMANHNNPISIFIPCHRVIGANAALTGYGGGLEIKEKLLQLEAAHLHK